MSALFRVTGSGFSVDLPDHVRGLLGHVIDELRDVVLLGEADAVRRLYPPAYADDTEREREYQALVHDDLLARRLNTLDTVESTLDAAELTPDQLEAWIGVVNDARLVLGTRLDMVEGHLGVPRDHPDATAHAVYELLTLVLAEAIDALQP